MKWLILLILMLVPYSAWPQNIIDQPFFQRDGDWSFDQSRGWMRMCPSGPFLGDIPGNKAGVRVSRPRKGCGAFYDRSWTNRAEIPIVRGVSTIRRDLLPAQVMQTVQVKRSGKYRFRACMIASQTIAPEITGTQTEGGIIVQLKRGNRLIAELPRKARFGEDIGEGSRIRWVNSFRDLPRRASRGRIFATRDDGKAFVRNRRWEFVGDIEDHQNYFVDGYRGHAGLQTAYYSGLFKKRARWTCHQKTVRLSRGSHDVSVEALPVRFDFGQGVVEDYDGWAAVREVTLKRK